MGGLLEMLLVQDELLVSEGLYVDVSSSESKSDGVRISECGCRVRLSAVSLTTAQNIVSTCAACLPSRDAELLRPFMVILAGGESAEASPGSRARGPISTSTVAVGSHNTD